MDAKFEDMLENETNSTLTVGNNQGLGEYFDLYQREKHRKKMKKMDKRDPTGTRVITNEQTNKKSK